MADSWATFTQIQKEELHATEDIAARCPPPAPRAAKAVNAELQQEKLAREQWTRPSPRELREMGGSELILFALFNKTG